MRYETFKVNAAECLELPKEVLFDLPLVTVTGSSEIMIDNFGSLREFSDKNIRISVKGSGIEIYGKELRIAALTAETIVVKGRLERIDFLR